MSRATPPTPPWGHPPAPHHALSARRARVRRRTLLLLVTAPVVLALVVLGLKLALLAPIASFARADYDDGAHLDAAGTYGSQRTLNLVEPWKAHFNTGTANARSQDTWALYEAIDALGTAYELAEDEAPEVRCSIQTNLSLAYEISGDDDAAHADGKAAELDAVEEALAARDAGRPYDEGVLDPYGDGNEVDPEQLRQDVQDWYEYAERSYATAEQIRGWPDCGEADQSPEQQEQSEAALQRLQDKQQEARQSQPENEGESGEGGPADGGEGTEQPDAPGDDSGQGQAEQEEQERRERLQEQGSEAREQADREEQEYRELYGDEPGTGDDTGDGDGGTKNW